MKGKKYGMGFVVKLVVAIVIIFAIGRTTLSSYALIDETNAVHIKSAKIENATLIIGTHLIYLGSMNDQIYEIAMKSAIESNQQKRYYKSEIAGGTWYDITEAKSLADITTDGLVVPDKEIEALFMTHHTKSDGLTYSLKKNNTVCLFDIENPYDLETMTELKSIKIQYDMMVKDKKPSETTERDLLYLKEIYKLERETKETKSLDAKIAALQTYYKKLLTEDADSAMCDMVMSVMEKLDASRRVKVLESLNNIQLPQMLQVIGREYVYIEGEITGDSDSVDEFQKTKAQEAAKEARNQVAADVKKQVDELEAELNEIEDERDAAISEKTNEVKDSWERIIEIETDDTKIPRYRELMNAEVQTASEKIRNEYSSKIEAKENEISNVKSGEQAKAQKAASEASTAVLNAKRDTLEIFAPNTELLAAISEAIMKVQDSYITYSSKMLEEGTTVLSQTEYRLVNELVEKVNSKSYASCDTLVKKLMYLDRINNSVVREETEEREFIEEELMKAAQKNYSSSLGAGTGQEYKTLASTASDATKNKVLRNQLNETEMKRNELQFILQAYMDRMKLENAIEFLTEQIEEIESYKKVIKSDAYQNYAQVSVDSYLEWLTKSLGNLQGSTTNSALENLTQQKSELQAELLTALDQELLEQAKKIEAQIKAVDMEIEEVEESLNAIIDSDDASASQKAIAQAQLGAGTASATLQQLKETALKEIKSGELKDVENTLEGIGALANVQPTGTLKALKEIYQEVAKQELLGQTSSKLSTLAKKIEEIIAEEMSHFNSQYSEKDLAALISSFMNGDIIETQKEDYIENENEETQIGKQDSRIDEVMRGLDQEQTAVVLAGLSMYATQNSSEELENILNTYAKVAFNSGNIYVHEQLKDPTYEAIPTDKLAQITGFRYIFSNGQKVVTLQKSGNYYEFEAFSTYMGKGSGTQKMTQAAGFQGVIYIPETIAKEYFNLTTQYLYDTSYGVILTEKLEQQTAEFVDYLLDAGGEF